MASFVGKPTISAKPVGFNIEFTVTYTASFNSSDLAFADGFAESVALFEDDSDEPFGGDHDHIKNHAIREFKPAGPMETRSFVFNVTKIFLDTELGGEEFFAVVHLRRNLQGITSDTIESDRIPLAF
ncbi:hypothetical protein [Nocardia sp. IFM 10818]